MCIFIAGTVAFWKLLAYAEGVLCVCRPLCTGIGVTKYKYSFFFFSFIAHSLSFFRFFFLLFLFDKCIGKFFEQQSSNNKKNTNNNVKSYTHREKKWCTTKMNDAENNKTKNDRKRAEKTLLFEMGTSQTVLCKVLKENYGETCAILFFLPG